MAATQSPSGIPHHPSSSNYTSAQAAQSVKPVTEIKIPDGRRNSSGEKVASPTETWTPKLNRRMSWNREDLKRDVYKVEMLERKESIGEGVGFTEVDFEIEGGQRKA